MRNELSAVVSRLEEIKKEVEGYLERTRSEEREAELENEIEVITLALEALNELE